MSLCVILDPFAEKEVGYWNFNDGTILNNGTGADLLGNGDGDGVILYDISRNTRVIQCRGFNCFKFS